MRLRKAAEIPDRFLGACAGGIDCGTPCGERTTEMVDGRPPTRDTLGMLPRSS